MKANDHPKYKKHLAESKKVIINAVSEMNDHVYRRKEKVRRAEARRHQQGIEDEDKTEEQLEEERYANQFEKKAGDATTQAEKAIRELIDYSDELAMQDTIMQEVNSNIASAPVPPPPARRRQRRQRNEGSDVDENEDIEEGAEEAPAADVEILSPLELFKQGKEDYTKKYTSKTMLERYLDPYLIIAQCSNFVLDTKTTTTRASSAPFTMHSTQEKALLHFLLHRAGSQKIVQTRLATDDLGTAQTTPITENQILRRR